MIIFVQFTNLCNGDLIKILSKIVKNVTQLYKVTGVLTMRRLHILRGILIQLPKTVKCKNNQKRCVNLKYSIPIFLHVITLLEEHFALDYRIKNISVTEKLKIHKTYKKL